MQAKSTREARTSPKRSGDSGRRMERKSFLSSGSALPLFWKDARSRVRGNREQEDNHSE